MQKTRLVAHVTSLLATQESENIYFYMIFIQYIVQYQGHFDLQTREPNQQPSDNKTLALLPYWSELLGSHVMHYILYPANIIHNFKLL